MSIQALEALAASWKKEARGDAEMAPTTLVAGTLLACAAELTAAIESLEVDDAMVLRACDAYDTVAIKEREDPAFYPAMHAALTAALKEPQ